MPILNFKLAIFILLIFFISLTCHAQQSKYTAFTVSDGLPSNNVYKCLEDNSGFLWVATDAGIARFDGKHFQVFTTEHGLPDNEVLSVIKEKNGRIWSTALSKAQLILTKYKTGSLAQRKTVPWQN